jgi:CrcB protein
MLAYALVALGSAIGGTLRYWLSGLIADAVGETFPWGTLAINVGGSLVIGFFATMTGPYGRWFVPAEGRIFVMAGICGGFTTFSSFSIQTLTLMQEGEWLAALANVGLSLALSLAAVVLGHVGAQMISR